MTFNYYQSVIPNQTQRSNIANIVIYAILTPSFRVKRSKILCLCPRNLPLCSRQRLMLSTTAQCVVNITDYNTNTQRYLKSVPKLAWVKAMGITTPPSFLELSAQNRLVFNVFVFQQRQWVSLTL